VRRVRPSVAVVVGLVQLSTACYSYVPVQTAPVGSRVAVEINDDGRVALREQLGPGVVRLEGRVSAVEGGALVVQASSVTQIRGRPTPIDSVRVRVSQGYVERVDERRLARGRTWVLIGGAVAVVAAFLLANGFGGRTPAEQPPGGPPVDESRGR
jgi:hypothetical protein